jgi:SOS-response transcriptional repressor LexA
MFGVSLPNTEHQLAFLQHQYQQLQQENMFYQTCIKNQQQQLEELKAKQIHALLRKKKRIGALHWQQKTTKTTSELQKTPPTLKPYLGRSICSFHCETQAQL